MLGGAETPNGASNWPLRLSAAIERGVLADHRLAAFGMGDQHGLAEAASIAAAAWRTCSMNEQPPTEVPSTQVGVMPR